jgi:hypothetical protein
MTLHRKSPPARLRLLHGALVLTWLGTALVSAIEWQGQAVALLTRAGITGAATQHALVAAGAGVDLAIGLGLLWRPGRAAYVAALLGMVAMTAVATLLLPSLWLDPLGSLLKNLPIAAALITLIRQHDHP